MIIAKTRVEIKTAICAYPAPAASRDAASGNATNPGIKVMQPMTAAITMPNIPESDPRSLEIACSSGKVRIRAYPIMRRAQIAPPDFSSGEADFPQESFVDFKGKRRCMTEKIPASCVRIISG